MGQWHYLEWENLDIQFDYNNFIDDDECYIITISNKLHKIFWEDHGNSPEYAESNFGDIDPMEIEEKTIELSDPDYIIIFIAWCLDVCDSERIEFKINCGSAFWPLHDLLHGKHDVHGGVVDTSKEGKRLIDGYKWFQKEFNEDMTYTEINRICEAHNRRFPHRDFLYIEHFGLIN